MNFFFCELCKPTEFKEKFFKRKTASSKSDIPIPPSPVPLPASDKKNLFRGRCYNIKNYDFLINILLKTINTETISIYLYCIHYYLIVNKVTILPTSFYWRDAALLYLYWIITYESYTTIQKVLGVSDSSAQRIIAYFTIIVKCF